MSAYPQALLDHFAQDVTTVCTCWRLTRVDGVMAGFTDHDLPLSVDGLLFEPETGFSASEARETLGMAVDTVDVEGALSSARIRDKDIAAGLYDGAKVERQASRPIRGAGASPVIRGRRLRQRRTEPLRRVRK